MKHLEAEQQKQVVTWARWASKSGKYPMLEMLHCSLNGVKLSAIQASIAKAQGMLSGVPDLFLPVKNKYFFGLYIEMKSAKGRVSVEQSRYLKCAAENGYAVSVCYSANEAIKRIEDYYE